MANGDVHESSSTLGSSRMLVGLAQGIVLLLLAKATEVHAWPATEPWLFVTLAMVIALVPLTVLAGLGQLRAATFVALTLGAAVAVGGIAAHSVLRQVRAEDAFSFPNFLLVAGALFVAYHLIAAADADGKPIARYRTYFDITWKNGVQLALSLAFLGAFWLLIFLGAALFELIKIDAVFRVIQQDWFAFPVSAAVFALGVHVSDMRVGLIAGARALALVLLSWLLPVLTLFAVAFLAVLPVVGLAPLWATGRATALLLLSAASLVVLINAAYQDGGEAALPHRLLRGAARVAGLALVPIVAIAAFSIWLRIEQHGLTQERVAGAALVAVAGIYALGYAVAAIWPGRWLRPLEATNVMAALVALGIGIALLTPLGDPARIAVADQVRRLQRGLVSPEQFDFGYLRFDAARYGVEALERLKADKSSPRALAISKKAEEVLAWTGRGTPPPPPAQDLLAKIIVYPKGATLPESFLKQNNTDIPSAPLSCAQYASVDAPCEAFFADFNGDGVAEIILAERYRINVFRLRNGVWTWIGYLDRTQCGDILPGLREGRFRPIAPDVRDLEIAGKRVRLHNCN